ncbi:MAG: T9SS type A sorting domain-containing protein, partial [Ignavibacteriales bacterium]|nr:T9SS type A sorting domain-containing protein [Ignavibacteriales bacterium]
SEPAIQPLFDSSGSVARVSLNSRWNLVSLPLSAPDNSKTVVFPTASTNAFAYEGSYVQYDTLQNGKGYWMKFSYAHSAWLLGYPLDSVAIPVFTGWNLIGSISISVAVNTILSLPGGIVTSQFYGYNEGYKTEDSIEPGKGYWVKVDQDGMLMLSSATTASASNRIKIIPTDELPLPPPDGERTSKNERLPKKFSLLQAYPNPFNPSTVIGFDLPVSSLVTLKVYDVLGREISALIENQQYEAGNHSAVFDAGAFPSGLYFYRISILGNDGNSFSDVKRMLMMK